MRAVAEEKYVPSCCSLSRARVRRVYSIIVCSPRYTDDEGPALQFVTTGEKKTRIDVTTAMLTMRVNGTAGTVFVRRRWCKLSTSFELVL
jgi:hypothetical protein